MIDVDRLLAQTIDAPPCGPNLEYDAAFLELEAATRGKPGQQFGDIVIPAQEPDWPDVAERAVQLLARTKDLRVAVWLTRARLHEAGLAGLNEGLRLIVDLLQRYWDQVHPQLDPDDNMDPTMRLNTLAQLVDPETVLRDLRNVAFLHPRGLGPVLVRDVEAALGKLPARADAPALTPEQVEAMAAELAAENPAPVNAVVQAVSLLQTLYATLSERVGSDRATDLKPLAAILGCLEHVCRNALPSQAAVGAAAAPEQQSRAAAAPPAPAGEIRTRQDALALLDKVCEFLERQEPANPAPLLIRRAKRLMTMNFVDIMRDLAPDSVSQIERLAGLDKE